jgi:hypothetical protein
MRLRLTNGKKRALASDPFEVLVRAVDLRDGKEQTVMRRACTKCARQLQCLPRDL